MEPYEAFTRVTCTERSHDTVQGKRHAGTKPCKRERKRSTVATSTASVCVCVCPILLRTCDAHPCSFRVTIRHTTASSAAASHHGRQEVPHADGRLGHGHGPQCGRPGLPEGVLLPLLHCLHSQLHCFILSHYLACREQFSCNVFDFSCFGVSRLCFVFFRVRFGSVLCHCVYQMYVEYMLRMYLTGRLLGIGS